MKKKIEPSGLLIKAQKFLFSVKGKDGHSFNVVVQVALRTDGQIYLTSTGQKEWAAVGSWGEFSLNTWASEFATCGWTVDRTKLDASRADVPRENHNPNRRSYP